MHLNRTSSTAVIVALLWVSSGAGWAQQRAPVVNMAALGPQVGATVPAFAGTDQFGRPQSLASLSGPKGLMLVFSRSADW